MTFKDLADEYERNALVPPKYIGDRKVAGQRSYLSRRSLLRHLRAYFGKNKLREITPNLIQRYRLKRLDTPIVYKDKDGAVTITRTRSISAVNRELQLLRRILNVALAEGWIIRSPFISARTLISIADEHNRERILTRDEEERLLAACCEKRERIRPVLICAIDTGMRKSEILKLTWADVDPAERIIHRYRLQHEDGPRAPGCNDRTPRPRARAPVRAIYERSRYAGLWNQGQF